jgi:serine/threonine protein kinase
MAEAARFMRYILCHNTVPNAKMLNKTSNQVTLHTTSWCWLKSFARKIIRPGRRIPVVDIEKEIAVILKICTSDHQNIVQVLQHGCFRSDFLYFIDMELCGLALDDYIHDRTRFVEQSPNFLNHPTFVSDNCSIHLHLLNVWTIIDHIAQGLEFIHREHYAHRDLKPANSINNY